MAERVATRRMQGLGVWLPYRAGFLGLCVVCVCECVCVWGGGYSYPLSTGRSCLPHLTWLMDKRSFAQDRSWQA